MEWEGTTDQQTVQEVGNVSCYSLKRCFHKNSSQLSLSRTEYHLTDTQSLWQHNKFEIINRLALTHINSHRDDVSQLG